MRWSSIIKIKIMKIKRAGELGVGVSIFLQPGDPRSRLRALLTQPSARHPQTSV